MNSMPSLFFDSMFYSTSDFDSVRFSIQLSIPCDFEFNFRSPLLFHSIFESFFNAMSFENEIRRAINLCPLLLLVNVMIAATRGNHAGGARRSSPTITPRTRAFDRRTRNTTDVDGAIS